MNSLQRQDLPPKPKDVLWVERIKGAQRMDFTVYSASLWGVWTHYTSRGTKPCYEDHDFCEGGHKEETLRWRGYVHAWGHAGLNKQVIVQLTEGACREWLAQCAEGVTLRGQSIQVYRTAHDKGRLHIQVNKWMSRQKDDLPPGIDPEKSLMTLWRCNVGVHAVHRSLVTAPADIPELEKVA